MANFNTNQARHLYVANDVKSLSSHTTDPATVLTTAGDIAVNAIPDGGAAESIYFTYRNADGLIVRSDMIDVNKIQYMTTVQANALAIPLNKATVTKKSGMTLANYIGKHLQLTVQLHEYVGLDYADDYPIVVDLYLNSTNTASDSAFYAAWKTEIDAAIKNFNHPPFTTSSSGSGLVIAECAQPWVPDKFEADPIHFDVFPAVLVGSEDPWGDVAVAASGSTVSGDFRIADLERFSYRERGETLGMTVWPYNYEPKYLVNPVLGTNTYGMLTIQYFYAGSAEDVQKSPRTIQIAASNADVAELKAAIDELIEGGSGGSGSGSGAGSGSGQG